MINRSLLLSHDDVRARDEKLLNPITPKPLSREREWLIEECLITRGYCTAIIVGSRPDRKPLPEAALYILGATEGNEEYTKPSCPVGFALLSTGLRKGKLVGHHHGNMVGRASRLTIAQLASTSDTAYL